MAWLPVVGLGGRENIFLEKEKVLKLHSESSTMLPIRFPAYRFPILLSLQEKRFPQGYFKINLCTIFYS